MMDLLQSLSSLRDLIIGARSRESDLVAEIARLKAERKAIIGAPLNRKDTEMTLLKAIQARVDSALADPGLLRDLADVRRAGRDILDGDRGLPLLAPLNPAIGYVASADLIDRLMALLSKPETILSRLHPALNLLDWEVSGLPMEERRRAVKNLDTQIDAAESELATLRASLDAAQREAPAASANGQPAIGTRKNFDGQWATWASINGGSPGWLFDPV